MNNDELKKKIAIICARGYDEWVKEDCARRIEKIDFDKLAAVLVAAGIGDVKEAEHRAEVAERAFVIITTNMSRLERGVRLLFAMRRISLTNALLQAEKELAEERKDD